MKTTAEMALSVVRHIAFRVLLAVSSAALTFGLLLGIALNRAFMQPYAPLSQSENLAATVMAAAFSIPALFGLIILLPQGKTWARWIGAFLLFVMTPVFLAALLLSGHIESFSGEFNWIILWIFFAIVYWMLLRPLDKKSLQAKANEEGEQGGDGDSEPAV